MTHTEPAPERRLTCARCGADFTCRPAGGCWCADETFRMPLPTIQEEDCLCPRCLRAAADAASR